MARFHENIYATTKMSQNRKCTFLLTSPLELESDEHTAALLWGGGWERAHTAGRAGDSSRRLESGPSFVLCASVPNITRKKGKQLAFVYIYLVFS